MMRDNFEQFGGNINMGIILRPIDEMRWPYISISMSNEPNSVYVVCEGINCEEKVGTYNAMLQFMRDNTDNIKTRY